MNSPRDSLQNLAMRKKFDRSDATSFDLKNGSGGIGDIEFLVQFIVLQEAGEHPDVLFYSDNIRQLDALVAAGFVAKDVGERLQDVYRRYRLYAHRRVLDGRKAHSAATEFVEEREFVTGVWQDWLD